VSFDAQQISYVMNSIAYSAEHVVFGEAYPVVNNIEVLHSEWPTLGELITATTLVIDLQDGDFVTATLGANSAA